MPVAFQEIPAEFVSKTEFEDYSTPVAQVISKIQKYGAVVVTKDGKYFGIVDDRTIGKSTGMAFDETMLTGKVAKAVPRLSDKTSVQDAINFFYDSSSKALPYIKDDKVTGIVKRSEILKAILSLHLLSQAKVKELKINWSAELRKYIAERIRRKRNVAPKPPNVISV